MVLEIITEKQSDKDKKPTKTPEDAVAAKWKQSQLSERMRKAAQENWGPSQAARNWVVQFMVVCYGLQRAGRIKTEGLQAVGRLIKRWIMALDSVEWVCDKGDSYPWTAYRNPTADHQCPNTGHGILRLFNPEQQMAEALEDALKALKSQYELISIKEVDIAPDIAMVPPEWQTRYGFPNYPNQRDFSK